MVRIDELQEAVAQIRMAVDKDQQAREHAVESDEENASTPEASASHWAFGAPYC